MKKNVSSAIIILCGYLLIQLMRSLAIFPGPDGDLHSFISTIRPDCMGESVALRVLWSGSIIFAMIALTMSFVYPVRRIWSELGLGMNGFLKGWAIGTALCIPMFITNAIAGEFVFSWEVLIFSALWPGFFEEIAYRGFPFGPLYRKCKWNFFMAILIPTVIFASGHLYQSHDLVSALLTLAVTGIGSLLFAWLYVEWDYNLWVPIALHAMMDAAWSLFPVGEESYGAAGNTITNVGRAITLILTVGITLWHKYNKQKAYGGSVPHYVQMDKYDIFKLKAVVLYILMKGGEMNCFHLFTVLYSVEKIQLAKYGQHLIADTFYAFKHGPAPCFVYETIMGIFGKTDIKNDNILAESLEPCNGNYTVRATEKPDMDELSYAEIEALDYCLKKNIEELTEESRDEAWQSAWNQAENPVINPVLIAKASGASAGLLEYIKEDGLFNDMIKGEQKIYGSINNPLP